MPKIRIVQMNNLTEINNVGFRELLLRGSGRRMAASTSKIRNKMVIKKNRKEKEFRSLWFGSNPHSKGDLFSRCFNFLILILLDRINMMIQRKIRK